MRIELQRYDRMNVIDSQDPELIGRWFAEQARLVMSVNAPLAECRLQVWPSTSAEEQALVGGNWSPRSLTREGLLFLASQFEIAAEKVKARDDDRNARPARH